VLFLTARDAVKDRLAGVDAGADDYLRKYALWTVHRSAACQTRRAVVKSMYCIVATLTGWP